MSPVETDGTAIEARLDQVDWAQVHADLDAQGWSIAPSLLTYAEADAIAALFGRTDAFRSEASDVGPTNTSATRCRP